MSEEEKKAYDNLIMLKYFTLEKEDKKAIQIILDLIEKQQKEIKELKEKNASLQKEIKLMKSININDNYISKDKINEKIKELENLKENQYIHLDYTKEILKELLEEN